MSCLEATFTLTPLSPLYVDPFNGVNYAWLSCYGADFWSESPSDFSSVYASNRFFFDSGFAADPTLDYTQWANLKKARFLSSFISLQNYAAVSKQLALIFGFDMLSSAGGRVLVYSNAGLLPGGDQTLTFGDNQFLLEIESLASPVYLHFIPAGGHWFFTGLSGYVV